MRSIFRLVVALGLVAASMGVAAAKDKLTFAYVTDPSHDIYFYAIRNGIVKSDRIDLDLVTTSIPALGQALLGQQYDLIEAPSFVIPPAVSQGLRVQFVLTFIGKASPGPGLSIWVNKDSPLTTPQQLKGKTIGTYGIGSSGVALIRVALAENLGFNIALRGGDVKFVEMPLATLPAALKEGTIDGATFVYAQVDQAMRTGEFRVLFNGEKVLEGLSGVPMVLPVIIGFPDRIAASPDDYREFNRMVIESFKYASEHPEMIAAIAKDARMPDSAPYLKSMVDALYPVSTPVGPNEIKAINFAWTAAKHVGLLENVQDLPDASKLVWPEALKPIQ